MIPLQPTMVDSSNVHSLWWEDGKLMVRFKHGGTYSVPATQQEAETALHASSVGKHIDALMKSRKGEKVE